LKKTATKPSNIGRRLITAPNPNHGIYIHIPFCLKKCAYCDFYSLTDLTLRQPFVDALLQEMALVEAHNAPSDTLYFGGGTPSVLKPKQIEALMLQARSLFTLTSDAEITMEINPGTVTREYLSFLRQTGINRINIGVQSFSRNTLKFLGRIHTPNQAFQAILHAREAGFDNVGLDLIFGIPGQDVVSWQSDLNQALSCSPEHLSCYILTFEEGTPLGQKRKTHAFRMLPEQRIARLFQITRQVLTEAGYEQYEISNYAKIDIGGHSRRSRHNWKYWSFAPYTGLGPSAHSYAPPVRYWNIRDMGRYTDALKQGRLPVEESEKTTVEQQMTEAIYLGLRTSDGIDTARFEETFHLSFHQRCGNVLHMLCEEKLLTLGNGRCALTPEGMLFHDGIVARLLNAAEK
jgi:oxygen-independent coproporphyrinogen-3 oxidase